MTTHHSKRTVPGSPITRANPVIFSARTPGRSESRTHFNERSRRFGLDDDNSNDVDKVEEALRELVQLTWNVWAVSPLFGLDYNDEVTLKRFGKQLREHVAASLSQENVSYEAKFTALEDLLCNPSDPPAVNVEVHSKNDNDEKTTCVYRGVFLSWGPSHKEETGSLQLPILLSRGLQTVTHAVHIILSQMFDCIITALPASQVDLMWLTVIILNSGNRVESRKSKQQTQRELILEYQVPGLPSSELIKVKLPLNSVLSLWSKICPLQPSTLNPTEQIAGVIELNQVEKFFECIRIQMLNNASLELGYCLLDKLSLPSFTIKANKMRATDIGAMDRVLLYFQEKALLYSPNLIPSDNNEGG